MCEGHVQGLDGLGAVLCVLASLQKSYQSLHVNFIHMHDLEGDLLLLTSQFNLLTSIEEEKIIEKEILSDHL